MINRHYFFCGMYMDGPDNTVTFSGTTCHKSWFADPKAAHDYISEYCKAYYRSNGTYRAPLITQFNRI